MAVDDNIIIVWKTDALDISITLNEEGVPCVGSIVQRGEKAPISASPFSQSASVPIDSVRSVGDGHSSDKTAKSLLGSMLSSRLRYVSHQECRTSSSQTLNVISTDAKTCIQIIHHFEVYGKIPVLRSWASALNTSSTPATITQLSSLSFGGLTTGSRYWWDDYSIMIGRNGWFREAQWIEQSLPDVGLDNHGLLELDQGHRASQARYTLSNHGSFSTGTYLPMGVLKRKDNQDTWAWQIEHNGSWRWEVGDFQDSIYLVAGGPTRVDHDWSIPLAPGDVFKSAPVALCHVKGSVDDAFAGLTDYRRMLLKPHRDYEHMPIIFNDYMNCLMGDPTEDKIKALLEPVRRAGAEYFVIDAGWYADDSNWWDDVGLWEPSKLRFPSGFKNLLDEIRRNGLIPGVWLEPEVVGVRSIVGKQLPDDAFFQEEGHRLIERGRFQLDYRHPAVRERMHGVVTRIVEEYGVGYFKFDYNIEVMSGSDTNGQASGAVHFDHQRAYLAWVNELLDKYPNLVIENCSSGAQRMEYAMLATHTLQSTSDQQDPVLYAAIAAAVPTAVIPEQSATWAYPQRAWSDEINALTVVNSMLGRVHLSGRLDQLEPHQSKLVTWGMDTYKSIRHDIKGAVPFWPLGLPKWHDDWIALGLKTKKREILLSIWRRGGADECSLTLPLGSNVKAHSVDLLYPPDFPFRSELDGHVLKVHLPAAICARVLRITAASSE